MAGPEELTALARLREAAEALVTGVGPAVERWCVREVDRIVAAWGGLAGDRRAEVLREAAGAGRAAGGRVAGELAALLAADPDDQRATPLEVVRTAVREPTGLLAAAGLPYVVRDPFEERSWPEDRYGLSPRTLRDVDEDLAAVHFAWGVAKAQVIRARRGGRPEAGGSPEPR